MRIVIEAAALIVAGMVSVAFAGQIDSCPGIKNDKSRLDCYDKAMSKRSTDECDAAEPGKFSADCINEKLQKQRP